jgi:hypothetical protein
MAALLPDVVCDGIGRLWLGSQLFIERRPAFIDESRNFLSALRVSVSHLP